MKNTIAIITARGGSKRIPQKNIKPFFGKPMIGYAIEACKEAGIFSTIMVSTDSKEIAEIARSYGAKIPFMRSDRTSSDFATTYDVLEEVVTNYENKDISFDSLCCVYPCVPFLRGSTLKSAYAHFNKSTVEGVQPVCKYPVPIEWAMKIENGILVPNDHEALKLRSQDLTPKYFDVGMFYFIKTKALLEQKTLVPSKTFAYIMNENEIQDIDTMDDWNLAELKMKLMRGY